MITKVYEEQSARNNLSEREAYILKTAKIIKTDVSLIPANKANYPSSETLANVNVQLEFLPISLRLFLNEIFTEAKCDLKVSSIGQAIVQAIRPRSIIAPLQLGLAVQLHHTFKSKFLIETLYRMGFSSSYSEVQKFRYCAASTVDEVLPNPSQVIILSKTLEIRVLIVKFQLDGEIHC